jgi:hypothetical protein
MLLLADFYSGPVEKVRVDLVTEFAGKTEEGRLDRWVLPREAL